MFRQSILVIRASIYNDDCYTNIRRYSFGSNVLNIRSILAQSRAYLINRLVIFLNVFIESLQQRRETTLITYIIHASQRVSNVFRRLSISDMSLLRLFYMTNQQYYNLLIDYQLIRISDLIIRLRRLRRRYTFRNNILQASASQKSRVRTCLYIIVIKSQSFESNMSRLEPSGLIKTKINLKKIVTVRSYRRPRGGCLDYCIVQSINEWCSRKRLIGLIIYYRNRLRSQKLGLGLERPSDYSNYYLKHIKK